MDKNHVDFTAKGKSTSKIRFNGRLHIQYDNLNVDDDAGGDPAATNNFFLRRIRLGAKAQLDDTWSGQIVTDFGTDNPKLDSAFITGKWGDHKVDVGYKKVNFSFEENTSSAKLKTVERTPLTRYWSESNNGRRLGFGTRHTGIYGTTKYEGFTFTGALVNGFSGEGPTSSPTNNELGLYASAHHATKIAGGKLKSGVNFGYAPEGDSSATQKSAIWGVNLFVEYTKDRFYLMGELITGSVENGAVDNSDTDPFGFTILPTYKICDSLEAVFRYSYLDTDGRGIRVFDGIRNAPNPAGNPLFDTVQSYYFGGNWFLLGNDVKLTFGYEYAEHSDRIGGGQDAVAHAFRSRLQLLF